MRPHTPTNIAEPATRDGIDTDRLRDQYSTHWIAHWTEIRNISPHALNGWARRTWYRHDVTVAMS